VDDSGLRKPSEPDERPDGSSMLPFLTVVGVCVGLVLVVFACAGVPGLLLLLAICGVAAFIGLQYLAWGWWLGERIRREELEARERGEVDE
jgi:hypothetical protein